MNNSENQTSKSTIIKVIDFTMDKVIAMKQASGVVGERIEVDGIVIIPVSKVSIGFAGGGADISDSNKGKSKNPAGTGASITDTPLVFLVIQDGKVQVLSVSGRGQTDSATDLLSAVAAEAKKLFAGIKARRAKNGKTTG